MSTWQDEYVTLLDDCERREERLSDWERGYVEMAEDPSGQYANVLRRPGEDEDEYMEP